LITIETYEELKLESFAFNIQDVTVLIEFYQIVVGPSMNQRFLFYNATLNQKDKQLCAKHVRWSVPFFDEENLTSLKLAINSLTNRLLINTIDASIVFIPGIVIYVTAEDGDVPYYYFCLESENHQGDKYNSRIAIREQNSIISSIKSISQKINNYCNSLLKPIEI